MRILITVPVKVGGLELVAPAERHGCGDVQRRLVQIHDTTGHRPVIILDVLVGDGEIQVLRHVHAGAQTPVNVCSRSSA